MPSPRRQAAFAELHGLIDCIGSAEWEGRVADGKIRPEVLILLRGHGAANVSPERRAVCEAAEREAGA